MSAVCYSGPGDEKGVRRTAEEERTEWRCQHSESVAEFRHGGLDGGEDVKEECGDGR